jgi:hypothetical protein
VLKNIGWTGTDNLPMMKAIKLVMKKTQKR